MLKDCAVIAAEAAIRKRWTGCRPTPECPPHPRIESGAGSDLLSRRGPCVTWGQGCPFPFECLRANGQDRGFVFPEGRVFAFGQDRGFVFPQGRVFALPQGRPVSLA